MWTRMELKTKAKETLGVNYWRFVLLGLISVGISAVFSGISFISGFYNGYNDGLYRGYRFLAGAYSIELLSAILFIFVGLPFVYGICAALVKMRNNDIDFKDVVSGFGNNYMKIIGVYLLVMLFTFLWSLLFVIPGIIKSYEYKMIPYLLVEHPDWTWKEYFEESKRMTMNQKASMFVLDLSFIGWFALSGLTLGLLGIFYVTPYIFLTELNLYRKLSEINSAPNDSVEEAVVDEK